MNSKRLNSSTYLGFREAVDLPAIDRQFKRIVYRTNGPRLRANGRME